MNFLVTCKTHGGALHNVWLYNQNDFWHAVESAKYLPQPLLPPPAKPCKRTAYDYLHNNEMHEWRKAECQVRITNSNRINEVVSIKPWELS